MTTTSNYYAIYIEKVIQLAQTIVIKSEETADTINRYIRMVYGENAVNDLDPTTWKYYKHLAGEYHFSDLRMTVTSMDTLEQIEFNKENLAIHRATARGYVFGTRQYQELVSLYPDQEMLILGILYPVDIQKAIAGQDGEILGFPPELVEVNEYSFVAKLQTWIDGFKLRWMNKISAQYNISDNLFTTTMLGVMYAQLVPAILNIRLAACKTNEAHSFHVRQYLGSHGFLDVYMDQLTTKQALFFYRNIAYIERNAGAQHLFDWLVEHIMTERKLPLAEYTMRHDLTEQPTAIDPTLTFHRKPVNLGYSFDRIDEIDLEQMLLKEDKLARDNAKYREDVKPEIQEVMQNSLSNVLQTKMLESNMVDYGDDSPYTMESVLFNHWLYLSSKGYYTAYVGFNNPRTGERVALTVKDAYCFMWYAFCRSFGLTLDEIPHVFAQRVQRILPGATVNDLMRVVDKKLIKQEVAVAALSVQPIIDPIISIEAFYRKCKEIQVAMNRQRGLVSNFEHKDRRGMAQNMVNQIYCDAECLMANEGDNYTAWLSARNIAIGDWTQNDFGLVYLDIIREATGLSLTTTTSLRDLQAAMVKMLGQLSSYSVQFVNQINSTTIVLGDKPAARVGDVLGSGSSLQEASRMVVGVEDANGKGSQAVLLNMDCAIQEEFEASMRHTETLELPDLVKFAPNGLEWLVRVDLGGLRVRQTVDIPQNQYGIVPVLGIPEYLALTPLERTQIKDVYGTCWYPVVVDPGAMTLDSLVRGDTLPGLDYDSTGDLGDANDDLDGFDPV